MLVTPNGVPKPEKFGSQEFISSVVSDVEKKSLNSVVKIFVKFDQNSGYITRKLGACAALGQIKYFGLRNIVLFHQFCGLLAVITMVYVFYAISAIDFNWFSVATPISYEVLIGLFGSHVNSYRVDCILFNKLFIYFCRISFRNKYVFLKMK